MLLKHLVCGGGGVIRSRFTSVFYHKSRKPNLKILVLFHDYVTYLAVDIKRKIRFCRIKYDYRKFTINRFIKLHLRFYGVCVKCLIFNKGR